MYVYAVVSQPRRWFTGVEHIKRIMINKTGFLYKGVGFCVE